MKKIFSMFFSFLLIVGSVFAYQPLTSFQSVSAEEQATLTIHYNRGEKDYDGWNLWSWDKTVGTAGSVVEATFQDDFGIIFETKVTKGNEAGFIVRLNDWESKNCGEDQVFKVDKDTEIWLLQDDCKIYTENPTSLKGDRKPIGNTEQPAVTDKNAAATLFIHYYRFDQNYDKWNFWVWPKGGEGSNYDFTGSDTYGQVAEINLPNLGDNGEVGYLVRLGNWEAKDGDQDRFVKFSETDKVGGKYVKHIYLLQGNAKHYNSASEVDKTPGLESAMFTGINEVLLSIQGGATDTNGIKITVDGKVVEIAQSSIDEDGKIVLKLKNNIEIGKSYIIEKSGFKGTKEIGFQGLYNTKEFNDQYFYDGADLGATYTKDATKFRLWAPTASQVFVNFYPTGDYREDNLSKKVEMKHDVKGTWILEEKGDLAGVYYTYEVHVSGQVNEAVDPYAKAVGVNGHRAMVIDLSKTNPDGFIDQSRPKFSGNFVDAILYELHIRDLSTDPNSGIKNAGKYLGVVEEGTKTPNGTPTGIDHLKDLGITHLHLLPAFDHRSIDETKLDQPQFNWGYDPYNYNVPEGSYSTDPNNGAVRVNEYKQMVQGLHDNGIRVVMDVVYNHTGASEDSYLNKIVPGYYYRTDASGKFSNGSGCGNETASERAMVRKFMVDSVVYWATEYKVDGFRFDLMALHDIETMNEIRAALDKVDPSIVIYGEGWTGGSSPLVDSQKALKVNVNKMNGIAVFSDDIRDGIKGSVFEEKEQGFVQGEFKNTAKIRFGITGGIKISSKVPDLYKVTSPNQTINYVSAHDNSTLWDKIAASSDKDEATRIQMDKMANAIVLTSQGVPFLHAGEEFLRSKDGNHNSYNASDLVNQLKWTNKEQYKDVYEYYKGLIALRKSHPEFRLGTEDAITKNMKFYETERGVIAYEIKNGNSKTIVVFNANETTQKISLPKGNYDILVNGKKAGTTSLGKVSNSLNAEAYSTYVLVSTTGTSSLVWIITGIALVVVAAVLGFLFYTKKIVLPFKK